MQKVQINRLQDLKQDVRVLKGLKEVKDFLEDCEHRLSLQAYWEWSQLCENDGD